MRLHAEKILSNAHQWKHQTINHFIGHLSNLYLESPTIWRLRGLYLKFPRSLFINWRISWRVARWVSQTSSIARSTFCNRISGTRGAGAAGAAGGGPARVAEAAGVVGAGWSTWHISLMNSFIPLNVSLSCSLNWFTNVWLRSVSLPLDLASLIFLRFSRMVVVGVLESDSVYSSTTSAKVLLSEMLFKRLSLWSAALL